MSEDLPNPGKEIKKAYAFVLVAPVFKYVLKLIVSPIVDGIVDLEQILMDLYSIGVSCVLEILQLWIIIYVARAYIDKQKSIQSVIAKASSRMGQGTQGSNPGLPYGRQMLYPLSHQGIPCELYF